MGTCGGRFAGGQEAMQVFKRLFLALALVAATGLASADGLVGMDGRAQRLQDYVGGGKWLVVMVWASTCHVCNAEVHEMVAFQAAHAGRDASVLGVAIDGYENRAGVDAFIARHRVNFPNLIDDGSTIVELFAREAGMDWQGWTPSYLVFDPAGRLVAKNIGAVSRGDLEKFIASYRPVASR